MKGILNIPSFLLSYPTLKIYHLSFFMTVCYRERVVGFEVHEVGSVIFTLP